MKIFELKFFTLGFYYCFNENDTEVEVIMAEVTNTPWDERHSYVIHKKAKKKNLKVIAEYKGPIEAPIEKDQEIGILKIYFKENFLSEHTIYASSEIKKINLLARIVKSINYLIWGDV